MLKMAVAIKLRNVYAGREGETARQGVGQKCVSYCRSRNRRRQEGRSDKHMRQPCAQIRRLRKQRRWREKLVSRRYLNESMQRACWTTRCMFGLQARLQRMRERGHRDRENRQRGAKGRGKGRSRTRTEAPRASQECLVMRTPKAR